MSQNINAASSFAIQVISGVEVVNLTPHAIHVMDDNGTVIHTIKPSGLVARVAAKPSIVGTIAGIPVRQTQFGEIENLPEQVSGRIYLVSSMLATRAQREDVLIPDDAVRDTDGRIIGCKAFGRV